MSSATLTDWQKRQRVRSTRHASKSGAPAHTPGNAVAIVPVHLATALAIFPSTLATLESLANGTRHCVTRSASFAIVSMFFFLHAKNVFQRVRTALSAAL